IDQVIELNLAAARAGDRQAFARLVAATQNTVTSIALAITRDVGHSEDIAQEAYLKVWSRLGSLRQPGSFLPWLRQITRNLARDHLRKIKSRPGDEPNADASDIASEQVAAAQPDGEAALLEAEQAAMIRRALDALPDDSREVLTLYYREGESSRQVARLLGLSDAAVRKRLSRARASLREEVRISLARSLAVTVPGAAFTTVVTTVLMTASPPAAAAAALGLGAKSGFKLLAGVSVGALLGLIGGIAGVILGLRKWIRTSTDPEELEGLLRLRRAGLITVVLAVSGFTISGFFPGWWPATLTFVLFLGAIGWQHMVALPRVLAPRMARERASDPAAATRQRRQRILAWVGMVFGAVFGGAGLAVGLIMSGRWTV
ncbi:MAG: sigma-70 family RNA polymerase sigma factor, partial [Wenzhouxiangella sp.]|nr:sigma-70 family RNA polymerase sigma factor [Wenzhouxiangella sp.]